MSDPIHLTGSQNLDSNRTDSVKNQPVVYFENREVIDKNSTSFKGLPEKVRSGFSFARSFGRVLRAVKEGVGAFFNGIGTFFKKHFGGQSEAPTVQAQVEMDKSSSPKYKLVDVPGNGNCGIYAVLVGMGALDSSEFRKPTHPDQGPHPLANAVQEQKVGELRKKSAEIAHKALGSRYSLEELKNMNEKELSNKEKKIKNLLEMDSSVSEDNMKFVTEAIQKPIMVHVFRGNFCSKTLFEVGKDGQYWDNMYGNEVYPEIKASEDTIHLYLSNGHYQLMVPD